MSINSTAPPNANAPNTASGYPMASLYVGDLHPNVDETLLFNKFSSAGPVISIRVCRDMLTRRSLGYAYINFQQPADAERVLDTLNFEELHGQPIRIMWSQRDPSLRKSGVGNVFIKNLAKDIDNKALYDTFSVFGNILSCKIMHNMEGKSRGFGFVHFESEEAAKSAIQQVNGMSLHEKKVYVGKFKSKAERKMELGDRAGKFMNVFIKNFAELLDNEKLTEMFEKFGEIYSARVFVNEEGVSKGFGFVCFKNPESAERAVEALNGTMLGDRKIYVGRAQEKIERVAEIKRRMEALRIERASKFRGVNLYVKNLDDSIDDERLKKEFSSFGEITSAKVMMENGRSKGFGFVCFALPEDATKAITLMNNNTVGSKPLYVALAQRKEERRQHLQNMVWNRISGPQPGRIEPQQSARFATPQVGHYPTLNATPSIHPIHAAQLGFAAPSLQATMMRPSAMYPNVPANLLHHRQELPPNLMSGSRYIPSASFANMAAGGQQPNPAAMAAFNANFHHHQQQQHM